MTIRFYRSKGCLFFAQVNYNYEESVTDDEHWEQYEQSSEEEIESNQAADAMDVDPSDENSEELVEDEDMSTTEDNEGAQSTTPALAQDEELMASVPSTFTELIEEGTPTIFKKSPFPQPSNGTTADQSVPSLVQHTS
jgi:hypothetical protein